MSVDITLQGVLTVVETLTGNAPFASTTNKRVTHNLLNQSETLSSTSSVPVTKVAAFSQAMSAGLATIDLTALTGTNGATVTFSGLKVQCALISAPDANTAHVHVKNGTTNGYQLFGAEPDSDDIPAVTLEPGQWVLLFGNESLIDVDGTHKTIDLEGSGAETVEFILVAG